MILLVLVGMIAAHVYADITLQSVMCDMKQKSWWEAVCQNRFGCRLEDTMYTKDFIAALCMHALEWAVVSHLPLLLLHRDDRHMAMLAGIVVANAVVHGIVDHLKANVLSVSLCEDQLMHVTQLLMALVAFSCL